MKKIMLRMLLVFSIFIFLFGMNIISAIGPVSSPYGKIIIVDDEGDGDYTSIKEAVNNSAPGDTIEVYSGTFNEHSIYIEINDVSIIGIPYELGNGNDSGKPFINTGDSNSIFIVNASGVVITNFKMNSLGASVIRIQATNCIVSNNNITGLNKGSSAVRVEDSSKFQIIGNEFKNFKTGIFIRSGGHFNISHNVLQNCKYMILRIDQTTGFDYSIVSHNTISNGSEGIGYSDSKLIISYNKFSKCDVGIHGSGYPGEQQTRILNNEIRVCDVGVMMYITSLIGAPKLKYNNFIDNLKNIFFHQLLPIRYSRFFNPILSNNYYDDWSGNGPYWVLGSTGIIGPFLPWIIFDWFPVKEPYDI